MLLAAFQCVQPLGLVFVGRGAGITVFSALYIVILLILHVKAATSNIDYDFLLYAKQRLEQYWGQKAWL